MDKIKEMCSDFLSPVDMIWYIYIYVYRYLIYYTKCIESCTFVFLSSTSIVNRISFDGGIRPIDDLLKAPVLTHAEQQCYEHAIEVSQDNQHLYFCNEKAESPLRFFFERDAEVK